MSLNSKPTFSRRSLRAMVFAAFVMLIFSELVIASPRVRRIRFRRGATTATVTGRLRNINDEALFVLRARGGQRMRVNIIGQGSTRGWVIFPTGEEEGAPGGVIFDGVLPQTGDYRIRVKQSQMADEWNGTFKLEVSVH